MTTPATKGDVDSVRDALAEILELCAIGDVDECTEALGWGKAIQRARAALSEARAVPEWQCACDEQGRGEPGVTCGDCPRDYGHCVTPSPTPVEQTVPWPEVTRYSGGASHEGIGGRVWVRLADDGPEVEYAPTMPDTK